MSATLLRWLVCWFVRRLLAFGLPSVFILGQSCWAGVRVIDGCKGQGICKEAAVAQVVYIRLDHGHRRD